MTRATLSVAVNLEVFVVHADEKLTAFLELESQLVVKGIAPVAGCTTKAP
jgi:hypothetical protein